MCSLIVRRCDSLESLLSCSIPNLKLDRFAVYINGSDLEVDSDGWHEVVMEYIVLIKEILLVIEVNIGDDIFSDNKFLRFRHV